MNELILALLVWIASESGLLLPPPPPVILVSREHISGLAYGRGGLSTEDMDVRAAYDLDASTVYLRNDWDPTDLRSRASLLHELIHHTQSFNKVPARCPGERERLAYELTLKWLREEGATDPYEILDIDPFTIHLISTCPEG
jgi:hypothetical protein